MTLPTYHIHHETPRGREPFTLMVFGPYSNDCYDVEVYRGHVTEDYRTSEDYVGTVSDLPRNTHVIMDVWDWMDAHV